MASGSSGFGSTFQPRSSRGSAKRLIGRVNLPLCRSTHRHDERPVLLGDAPGEPRVDRLFGDGPFEPALANPLLAPLMEPGRSSSTGNDCPYIFRISHRANHASLNISELQAEKFGTVVTGMCATVLPHGVVAAARPNNPEERLIRQGCGRKGTCKRKKFVWVA